MAEAKKRAMKKSWRDKGWYEIVAPPMFANRVVGDTPALEQGHLIGRVFETTLGDVIDDFSKSHIKLYFQVKKTDGGKAITNFIGHEVVRDYIRSQVRRRAGKIEDVATVTTQDGYKLRLSSMVTTLRRMQTSKLEAIRGDMRKVVVTRAGERTFEQFVLEMVLGKLSSDIYKEAKRYCPVHRVEVYKSKVIGGPA